ncbi:MAG: ABC transporter ATP-binding protein [Polyangiaceae bacterium]|nr:ABC transporter ATP-binding protein [Polyangiaceae bacterium]
MHIELRDVGKRFGRVSALSGVTLVIPPGSRVGLIGPNGSGKSTLLRVVMGLLSCDGDVLLDGRSPFVNRVEIAGQLAYVPQLAPQLGAPVGEVVRSVEMLRSLDRSVIMTTARKMALDLAAVWRRPFRALSGGTKQKLLIALALSSGASLLILDEPTASLDVRARESFDRLLGGVAAGTTVILCSHRLDDVQKRVDRVVSLAEGRLVYDGPALDTLDERHLAPAGPAGEQRPPACSQPPRSVDSPGGSHA